MEAFLNAVRFYDLLASDPIILNRLQTQLRPTDSVIYPFFVDIAIYQGRHKEALKTLRHIQSANNTPVANCRFHLKSAALCFAIGDKQSMVDQVSFLSSRRHLLVYETKWPFSIGQKRETFSHLNFLMWRAFHSYLLTISTPNSK